MKYLLDSDHCTYLLKQRLPVIERLEKHAPAEVAISAISEAEIRFGIVKNRAFRLLPQLERLLAAFTIVPFESAHTTTYAALRHALRRAGTPIGANDLFIASQAVATSLVLVTNNEREFRRVPGLKIENWAA